MENTFVIHIRLEFVKQRRSLVSDIERHSLMPGDAELRESREKTIRKLAKPIGGKEGHRGVEYARPRGAPLRGLEEREEVS